MRGQRVERESRVGFLLAGLLCSVCVLVHFANCMCVCVCVCMGVCYMPKLMGGLIKVGVGDEGRERECVCVCVVEGK